MAPEVTPLWTTTVQAVPVLAAYAWFAAVSVVLARIDMRIHRLPDRIVLPGCAVAIGCLGVASVVGGSWPRLLGSVLGAAGLFLFFLLLRAVSRRSLGGGDVKLAGLIGLHLGWLGLTPVLLGTVAAFLLGGVWAAALLLLQRATPATRIPFGPFLIAGAWLGILYAVVVAAAM